jgi:hypothetical protein
MKIYNTILDLSIRETDDNVSTKICLTINYDLYATNYKT